MRNLFFYYALSTINSAQMVHLHSMEGFADPAGLNIIALLTHPLVVDARTLNNS